MATMAMTTRTTTKTTTVTITEAEKTKRPLGAAVVWGEGEPQASWVKR
jgi:hypothetical protein